MLYLPYKTCGNINLGFVCIPAKTVVEQSKPSHKKSGKSDNLEGVSIPADTTAEGKLLPCGWVLYMQGTLLALQLFAPWATRAFRKLLLWYTCHLLEVVMAQITEVSGSKAEKHGH